MDTRDARTLWFLRFLADHNINEIEFLANENKDEIMACYTVSLFDGNTIQGKTIKTATIKGYIQAVNDFCVANQQKAAVNFKIPASKVVRLLNDQAKFEEMPARRLPFTPGMTFAIMITATKDKDFLGLECAISNWTGVGRLAATRLQEFAQDKDDEVMMYVTPSGERIVRAFTRGNVTLFDKDNVAVASAKPSDRAKVTGTIIEYDVQKNRENKQKLGYDRCTNLDRKRYDLTENMMQIIDRADQLGQPHHLPLAVFKDTAGKVKYLTGQVYTEFVRQQIKKAYPLIPDNELSLYSTHSLRVTAANLLHEAGKDGSYIKLRCRWKSDCFEIYLRNTVKIRRQHAEALQVADNELVAMGIV